MAIFHYNMDRPEREDQEIFLSYWGKEKCTPGHSFGPGVRDVYKIHFIHSGQGLVRVGRMTYELSAGQAFLSYPGEVIYYQADESQPWTYSWVAFQGKRIEELLSRTRLTPEEPVFPMDTRLMPDLYNLLNEAADHQVTQDLRLLAVMADFLSVLIEVAPASSSTHLHSNTKEEYIHRSLEYLHSHYCENVSLTKLATNLGLNRKYLSTIFKDATGLPPRQYLLRYRMERACGLLKKGNYTISEVAGSVGYQDALLFSKMFKKTMGVSPKGYRSSQP
ncbi:AraC family transcriptional regulator [Paenibacillus zeisoli]|uniref:AraC family transcriptional regulator n=1 Tax=Paenibacillus zeisoli TaxID=2496267 RepID=A0A3S1BBH9_9BACL|nr:AraC family transcriptional regulator [Paenibacillus zeisoli]RUT35595.1 AraC family transcriptional regulator [Paenibacillus zeisoli]